jgi:hypothetical protein
MHLSDILKEISIERGHASRNTSADIMRDLFKYRGGGVNWNRFIYPGSLTDDEWVKRTMPEDMRKRLRREAIATSGDLVLLRYEGANLMHHLLVTTDPAVPLAEAAIGIIESEIADWEYSLKTIYGIEAPKIGFSEVATEYRGKGYGAKLYDMILDHYGVLQSDSTLYAGSLAMWSKHMPRAAAFVGAMVGGYLNRNFVVVPLDSEDLNDTKFLGRAVRNIVAFQRVPSSLKKQTQAVSGLSLRSGTLQVLTLSVGSSNQNFAMDAEEKATRKYTDFDTFVQRCSAADYTLEEFVTALSKFNVFSADDVYTGKTAKGNNATQLVIVLLKDVTAYVSEDADGLAVWYAK